MQLPERAINSNQRVVITRRLPIAGEVLVQRGQKVQALEIIARAELPRRYRVVDVARQLARPGVEMGEVMLKEEGQTVEANEVIAAGRGGLPFLQRVVRAPAAGRIAAIGSGWILLEIERRVIELQAFVNGAISKIIPQRGAVIEAKGSLITATCGFGGEAYGLFKRLVNAPFESLQPETLDENAKNCILLGGRSIDEEVLRVAEAEQVRGIVVGSIDASLLKLDPPTKVRVVATEGFGDVMMSPYTFGILGTLAGQEVSIRGSTPTLTAGSGHAADELPMVLSTSVRVSSQNLLAAAAEEPARPAVEVGSRVRISRGRLLGASGLIESIPPA
ncbi:MAG: hypothetical protein AB1801_07990, partial [Chloroflexota bacterium]